MPKFATQTALQLIQQKTGTEPFFVIAVNWGGGVSTYSTREMPGMISNIMEIGEIRNERRADSMCNVGSVRVKLSDTDGNMKYVIDNTVAENWPAAVYLAFNGTTPNDWIILIHGRTVGPIEWDETALTMEMSIETLVQSQEIGFSATHDDFSDLNPNAEGVPWPMIFGACSHVPSLLVVKHPSAHLQCALRFSHDRIFDLINNAQDIVMVGNPDTLCFLNESDVDSVAEEVLFVDDASQFPQGRKISIIIDDVVFVGQFVSNTKFEISESNVAKYKDVPVANGHAADVDKILLLGDDTVIANCNCYFLSPSGKEWYNYCEKQEGRTCYFRFPFIDPDTLQPVDMTGKKISEVYAISKAGVRDNIAGDVNLLKDACTFRKRNAGDNNFGALVDRFKKACVDGSAWWSVPMDTEVRLWDSSNSDVYVASLSPLSAIKAVWGKRKVQYGNKTRTIFSQLPTSYYQVDGARYRINGMTATAIVVTPPLSDYTDQDWEEDIFVTATGSIGPNPIAIIKWAVKNYTDLAADPSMFARAMGQVEPQANFALFEKKDALKFCQEVAFQARCALLLDNGGVGPIFLPAQPTQQWNFDETSVKEIKLGFTERKDIYTKFIATYATTYKDHAHLSEAHQKDIRRVENIVRSLLPTDIRGKSENKIHVFNLNINRFGTRVRSETAYIFNDEAPVKKFCDFWGFRGANCWRMVTITTWLQGVRLQPFDGVVLNFSNYNILNSNLVPAVVDSVSFNPSNFTTTLYLWLPVIAGTYTIDPMFWPSTASAAVTLSLVPSGSPFSL